MPDWLSYLILVLLWCVWWLFAVDWSKAWTVLARGGWAPVVLLVLVSAYAWSQIAPGETAWGAVLVPNYWGQLGTVCGLVALALFCGWLQGQLGYRPAEIPIEAPGHGSAAHGHGHGHH